MPIWSWAELTRSMPMNTMFKKPSSLVFRYFFLPFTSFTFFFFYFLFSFFDLPLHRILSNTHLFCWKSLTRVYTQTASTIIGPNITFRLWIRFLFLPRFSLHVLTFYIWKRILCFVVISIGSMTVNAFYAQKREMSISSQYLFASIHNA